MGRPRKERPSAQPESPGQPPEAAEEQPPGETEAASTITLRLDESGKLKPMQAETRERLKRALAQSGLRELSDEEPVPSKLIDDKFVSRLFDGLSRAQAMTLARLVGVPQSELYAMTKLSPDEKAELTEPAKAILTPYFGRWLAQHQDLAGFLVPFTLITLQKYDKCKQLAHKYAGAKEQDEK